MARKKKPDCEHCRDNPRRKCKFCACSVCGGKDQPGSQILCDDCDQAFHIWCLSPPLEQVPAEVLVAFIWCLCKKYESFKR